MKQVESFNYSVKHSTSLDNFYVKSTAEDFSSVNIPNIPTDNTEIHSSDNESIGKYSIFDIANWFLIKKNMTHKKLQKLCYYAQAWCYALKGYRLANIDFQAWLHGPVSPALYDRFKGFGYQTIEINTAHKPVIEIQDQQLLEDVWETYGDKTGNALESLSHRELPWIEARRGYTNNERCAAIITPESMIRYYKSIYKG